MSEPFAQHETAHLKVRRIATLATLSLATLLSGCGSDRNDEADGRSERRLGSGRTYFHEREFAVAPSLAARSSQTVILDLEPAITEGALVENVSRHELAAGKHTFCLQKGDPYLRSLVLEDEEGVARLTLDRSSGCAEVELPAGVYRLRIAHDATGIVGAHRVAFVQSGNVNVPLNDDQGKPVGGWWAMRPDPSADPSMRNGRVAAPLPVIRFDEYYPAVQPLFADFANKQIDADALFIFQPARGSFDQDDPNRPRMFNGLPLNVAHKINLNPLLVADASGFTLVNSFNLFPLFVSSLGNNKGYLGQVGAFSNFPFALDNQFRFVQTNAATPMLFQLLLRFYPDGKIDPLRPGEVALFQQCNYGGKATVFAIDNSSFAELDSSVITLDRTTASVRLGNDTAVTLYGDTQYGGTSQLIQIDTPCLDGTGIGRNTRSIGIEPLLPIFLASSRSCVDCKLEGVDLTGIDLSGTNLQNADLSRATLANTKLHGALNLRNTNFSGARLLCTDFSGTNDSQRVDLTQTIFANAQVTTDFSCRANLTWTRVTPQALPPALWRYLDLSHAAFSGLVGNPLSSQAHPLDLSRAMLVGATLPGAIFDYASLANADLTQVVLSGASLKNVNLSNAVLSGTQLDQVNATGVTLTGALLKNTNVQGIVLDSATLANTNLSQVVLSGISLKNANFTNAILNGTQLDHANATGANLTGALLQNANVQGIVLDRATGFAGANLTQVVLSGASLQGVDFTGAMLAGIRLDGATLTGAKLDRTTGLPQATLTGIDLTNASLAGAQLVGVSFQQAILDGVTGLPGADLSGAFFNNTSAKNVDFSNALLYSANFTNANLENVNLSGAFLTANTAANPPLRDPANFTGAHLKNANLLGAKLTGTIFNNASFYGSFNGGTPTFPCQTNTAQCGKTPVTGYTCGCATAVGATLTDTRFNNAYLFGVDFGGSTTTIDGVSFNGAILVGANFSGANFNVDPGTSSPPDFSFAYLQGAILAGTNLTSTSLSGAFVDFGAPGNPQKGNIIQILLGPAYTAFKGWEAPNLQVCVQATYGSFTTVPTNIPTMTCPDGSIVPASGCGPTQATNTRWASRRPIGQASPPGFYQFAPTYGVADQTQACNGGTYNFDW